ncbi:hypothetical protein CFP56_027134 [Quercus suber]|uniref:Zinc knuckle CX2CX4HX4C domain-containing protein n=1 Tax=Quercus suber TaxID=58331 RepID=A0AAW0JYW3_QUESU
MYERLPNICYWCGLISHDDKDCDLWLSSHGSLRLEDQQFGSWIKAPQFNHVKKTVIEVQGYDNQRRMKPHHGTSLEVHANKLTTERPGRTEASDSVIAVPMEMNGSGSELVGEEQRHELEGRESQNKILDFEEILQDIDDTIHKEPMISISEDVDPKIPANQSDSYCKMIDIAVMEANRGWENQTWDLNGKLMKTDGGTVEKNVAFKVGWAEMGLEGMKNKTKPNKSGSKGKQKIRPICGPVVSKNKNANNGEMGLSEDTWRRVVSPCNHASPSLDVEIGLKRKSTSLNSEIAELFPSIGGYYFSCLCTNG